MSFWQEIEINPQQFVDQDLLLTEPRLLILSDPQAEAGGDSFLCWDDLIGQADSLCLMRERFSRHPAFHREPLRSRGVGHFSIMSVKCPGLLG